MGEKEGGGKRGNVGGRDDIIIKQTLDTQPISTTLR